MRFLFATVKSIRGIGQQRNMPSAFDRLSNLALMLRAVAADSSGHNFRLLRDKLAKFKGVFIIDFGNFICAENTNFSSASSAAA